MRIKSRKADRRRGGRIEFVEQQLITLYLWICRVYNKHPELKYQRLSNFRPRGTDEDLLTMYLFGHLQGFSEQRRIHQYVRRHWHEWFPYLPSYQAFNRRHNELVPAFEQVISLTLHVCVRPKGCWYIVMANWLWLVCS
jgi:hypothetical protein